MSKPNKTTAAKCGNPTITETRRDRWRRHIATRLCDISNNHAAYIPAAWLEEIEGRPMADVICDWLANNRGFGVKQQTSMQKLHADVDDYYEAGNVRARNSHEKSEAGRAVLYHLQTPYLLSDVKPGHLRQLVRRFYRAGDCGLDAAVARAVRCALDWEREAEANETV